MPPEHESNGRLTGRTQNDVRPAPAGTEAPDAGTTQQRRIGNIIHPLSISGHRKPPARGVLRLILFVLSAGGTAAAALLWLNGHGWLGARLLAGDVLLIIAIVLIASWF
jgi:hypothetical protein